MPRRFVFVALFVALLFGYSVSARAQTAPSDEKPLTNASIVKLARAGFSDKAVVAIINSRPSRFDLSAERLIELKKSGVSEKVILAMLGRGYESDLIADDGDWGGEDDSFFKGDVGRRAGDQGAGGAPGGGGGGQGDTNIFGSSGGSRGRARSRGGDGSAENDTQTVGSASVRIIRPPAEAGGSTAKMERTPTLSNESVMLLVEAGFSDGTIVRRIEQSPVEFDLSADGLAALRRRRVSDPVIAAMRAAMGEDGAQPAKTP